MRIGMYASRSAQEKVKGLPSVRHSVVGVASAQRLDRVLNATDYDLILFDPAGVREREFDQMLGELVDLRRPIGWYTDISAVYLILAAARARFGEFILRDHEGVRNAFEARLETMRAGSALGGLFERIAPRLQYLPSSLLPAAVAMFGGTPTPPTVAAWAKSISMPRRSLDRATKEAGFRTAATLLQAIRVAVAWNGVAEDRTARHRRLETAGYGSTRSAVANYKRLLGVTPRVAFREFRAAQVVDRLEAHLVEPAGKRATNASGP